MFIVPGITDSDFTELLISMKKIKESATRTAVALEQNLHLTLEECLRFHRILDDYINKVSYIRINRNPVNNLRKFEQIQPNVFKSEDDKTLFLLTVHERLRESLNIIHNHRLIHSSRRPYHRS